MLVHCAQAGWRSSPRERSELMCGLLIGRESARAGLRCYALIQAASSASAPPKRPLTPRDGARTGPATSRSRSLKLERDERTTLEERGRPLHPRPCSQTKAHMSANLPSARARAAARPAIASRLPSATMFWGATGGGGGGAAAAAVRRRRGGAATATRSAEREVSLRGSVGGTTHDVRVRSSISVAKRTQMSHEPGPGRGNGGAATPSKHRSAKRAPT